MSQLKLLTLQCLVSDEDYLDEIYIKINKKKIWPENSRYKKMEVGDAKINIPLPDAAGEVEIELWDWDLISRNDLLGTFNLHLDDSKGVFSTELKIIGKTNARYILHWEYF